MWSLTATNRFISKCCTELAEAPMSTRHTIALSKYQSGKLVVDLAMLIASVAVLAGTAVPSFQAYSKRIDYQNNVVRAAETAQRALESCLRVEKHIGRCKRGKDLTSHGFYPAKARLFDGVDKIEFAISSKEASVFVTPLNASPSMPSVTDEDDFIITASVLTDTNGNNRLSAWVTDPESGCAARGYCDYKVPAE